MSTTMRKVGAALLALQFAAFGALAQDAGVEFGVEDDLTVQGTGGHQQDADLEVKGFSVFGDAVGVDIPEAFTNGAGSVIITSNLWVGGQLKAGGIDLQGADMTVSNLTVQGSLTASGHSVTLYPDTTASSSLTVGNNLSVGSNAGVGGDLSVAGTLAVDGATTLNSTLVVGGDTTLNSALTVDGSGVFNTNVLIKATTPSTDKDSGALVIEGGVGIEQNLNVGGMLDVTGNATFDSGVNVSGAVSAGSLGVAGNASIGGGQTVAGDQEVGGDLDVTGAISGGSAAISGDATIGGTLGVTGAATILDTTESVDKDTGSLILEGGLGVEKSVNAGGNLGVGGNAAVSGNAAITGNATVGGTLGVTGSTTLGGTLGVTGAATAESDLTVKGNLMVWGTGTFSNGVTAVQAAFLATESAAAVGVGTAIPDAQTKLDVRGGGASGDYVVKFYAGSDLAAWVRKK